LSIDTFGLNELGCGYLHPPATGTYELYIAGDDQSELRLSNDKDPANACRVAFVPESSSPRQGSQFAAEQRAVVDLIAGQTYYIEVLHNEGSQDDQPAVAWKPPGAAEIEVVPETFLSPELPTVRLYVDQSVAFEQDGTAKLTVVRDTDLGGALDVHYTLSGNADGGDDYTPLPGTVTIPAGQRFATFEIEPVDDPLNEGDEKVEVTLAEDPNYVLLDTLSSRRGV
jgi:hypothetical protein